MEKLVSRNEAAEILQVCPQTISNYAKRGLLTEVKKGPKGCLFYYEHQVMMLMDDAKEIADVEQKIQEYKTELLETKKQFKILKEEWKRKLHIAQRSSKIYEVAIAIMQQCTDNSELLRREKYIIKGLLDLRTVEEIGEEIGLSGERVRQIFCKGVRKLRLRCSKEKRYDEIVNINTMLQREIEDLKKETQALKTSSIIKDVSESSNKNIFLHHPISDFGLSDRVHYQLKSAGIKTLADLVSRTKYDILGIRNLGRKSFNEIDCLLERLGLTLRKD